MSSDLKANLEKFIAHCQDLKHEDDPSGDGFTREFRDLREKQVREKEENKFPADEGKKHVNLKKNRYKDILPYDEYRVILDGREEGEDYINASYIKGPHGKKNYIGSQGPLPHTVNDFIRMLWQLKTEIVFMACRLEEGDPKKQKCEKYWTDSGESKEFGEITVTTEEETLPMKDFYRRRIRLSCDGSHHRVTQFHYIGWPDHGIPDHPSLLNIMINHMRVERKRRDIPLVVHCSAGCGRTGTICAIDYAWTLLNEGKIEKDFSLYDIILKMREQRQSLVQTPDQYELVHLVMENLFTEWIKNYDMNNDVDTEQLYYNVNLENGDEYEEDIYVNEDLAADENVYTECGNNFPKPVVVPTNQYYSNVDVKQTNQSADHNTRSSSHAYDNFDLPRTRTDSSCSSLNESTVVGEMYSMIDHHKKESERTAKPATKNSPGVQAKENGQRSPQLPPRNYTEEESERTVKPATKNSPGVQAKENGQRSPQLPPRNYTEEDIRSSKPDIKSSRLHQAVPELSAKESKPVVFAAGGSAPRRHAMKSASPSPTGTVTSQSNIPQGMYPVRQSTPIVTPLHKTCIQVPSRSAGVRRQPAPLQPHNNIRFKVGREEIVLPNHPTPNRPIVPASIISHTTHVQSGKPFIVKHYYREFHGQPIGYDNRTSRRPAGSSTPTSFVLRPRHFYFN